MPEKSPKLLSRRPDTVFITGLSPLVDGGRYPTKRVVGEPLEVQADIFKDGHDVLAAVLKRRKKGARLWEETRMFPTHNDRWAATCAFPDIGHYNVTIEAWSDPYLSWLHDFSRRLEGGQENLHTETQEGAKIIQAAAESAAEGRAEKDAETLEQLAAAVERADPAEVMRQAETPAALELMFQWADRSKSTVMDPPLPVFIERPKAQFSAWYEFFPRSAKGSGDSHSTFRDCLERVKDARDMGFDIVYLPPIHPIGIAHRKGKNNSLNAEPGDVGSPWAIGGPAGGHFAIEPQLGTVKDFEWLVQESRKLGVEVGLDFAINCSPDHPYVKEHPEWFFHRPDGTIKYAENPPKKYQDIYPLNFYCDDWRNLWREMVDIVLYWVEHGVRVFRVDNPHTKPVSFWEYLIAEVQRVAPETIFLSEAFTRPKMMQALAKSGFTQSYTYFTWRVSKQELTDYVTELTKGEMREYFRPNFWPNTPDILPYHLQHAPPAAFKLRAALAATLSTSWGIYSGYEFCENDPFGGKEEYNHSEKYQLTERDWDAPGNIKRFIARLNQIRVENPALQEFANVEFLPVDNDRMLGFYKRSGDGKNIILVVANLDFHQEQHTNLHLPLEKLGLERDAAFRVEDLMFDEIYDWQGSTNYVHLDPRSKPLHILKLLP